MNDGDIPPCPQCATTPMVRRGSALLWEGHSSVTMHGAHVGLVGFGLWPAVGVSTHRGSQVSSLAQVLSPPPPPPSRTAWWVWIMILGLYCAGWIGVGVWA